MNQPEPDLDDIVAQCVYCGVDLTVETRTVDHVIPLARGGADAGYNKAPSCHPCNLAKGPLTAFEYLSVRNDPGRLHTMINRVIRQDLAKSHRARSARARRAARAR